MAARDGVKGVHAMDEIFVPPNSFTNTELSRDAIEDRYGCAHTISTHAGIDGENCWLALVDDRVAVRENRARG